eukprot:scaffold99767_cov38-Prasinocladus_malaysianus.AAC.1
MKDRCSYEFVLGDKRKGTMRARTRNQSRSEPAAACVPYRYELRVFVSGTALSYDTRTRMSTDMPWNYGTRTMPHPGRAVTL